MEQRPINPYIAGMALSDEKGFFGRQDLLDQIKRDLYNPGTNVLVLFGQRRIGKTSLLWQLQRTLSTSDFFPIRFDLHDESNKPLGEVLADLADITTELAGMEAVDPKAFDNNGYYFRKTFLPQLYKALGNNRRPIFLLDEFDVIDQAMERQTLPPVATESLFPFLRGMISEDPLPAFVFTVGRQPEDLSKDFNAIFKGSLVYEVWVLDLESANNLVRQAEKNGTLSFTDETVGRILELTNCHPYFTQLLCQRIWERAHRENDATPPLVEESDVDAAISDAIEVGNGAMAWLWDGLTPAERIYAAAFSEIAYESEAISQDRVIQVTADYATRLRIREVERAHYDLRKRHILELIGNQEYRFAVKLFQFWIKENRPLQDVKDDLDKINPVAEDIFVQGEELFYQHKWKQAIRYFKDALEINPQHFHSQLQLGEALYKDNQIDESVSEFKKAYDLDRSEARSSLVRALLAQAKLRYQQNQDNDALKICEQVLSLSPNEPEAKKLFFEASGRQTRSRPVRGSTTTALIIGLGGTGQWVTLHVKKNLLEAYNNVLPPSVRVIAFDTVSKSTYSIGGYGEERRTGGRTIGQVRFNPGEYIHAVGDNTNVRYFVTEIAEGKHPHIGSWFQAAWYKQHVPDSLFDLAEGAGQFRQFGRLAVFNDLRAPARSRIYSILNDAIGALKRETNDTELQVFLVGSLAGGTGAGMFADIAHLVRQIALQANNQMKPTVCGYLVLPDAFSHTISDNSLLDSMRARAYAAIRENSRFFASFDWERGYPMDYNTFTESIWRGRIRGKLFDYLYYLDGRRPNLDLSQYAMEQGVAPTIADTITAILDGKARFKFKEYAMNVTAEHVARLARGHLDAATSVVGSVGTFTIVFPIYHLIEGWAYRLAREALEGFLQPTEVDPKTGVPTALARGQNLENRRVEGRDEAREFLKSETPIIDPFSWASVELTLVVGELNRISQWYQDDPHTIVDELAARTFEGWNRIFEPTGGDSETLRIKERTNRILKALLRDEVRASADKKPKGTPVDDLDSIESGVRIFKNTHLGMESPTTGQRSGGQYATMLNEYVEYHAERFRIALDLKTHIILNSNSHEPEKAKAGKLGYLIDFFEGVLAHLDHARQAMNEIALLRRQQGHARRSALEAAITALHEMRAKANSKIPVLGIPSPAAFDSQVRYLEAEQKVIDILQAEVMEQAVSQTIGLLLDYTESALASARTWAQTLALDSNRSLYAEVLRGESQVKTERLEDSHIPVRMVRPKAAPDSGKTPETDEEYQADAEYEESRYKHYLSAGGHKWRTEILGSFNWSIEHDLEDNKPKVRLKLSLTHSESTIPAGLNPVVTSENLERLLEVCRLVFEPARQIESVMAYLQAVYPDPTILAQIIYERSGVLLANQGNPVKANYLRVAFSADDPGQNDYLTGMMQYLGNLSSTGIAEIQDAAGNRRAMNFGQQVNSDDRFKCSLIHTEELIALNQVKAFTTARNAYIGYDGERVIKATNRRILHIFPAEVNAVGYEDRLSELNQPGRQFSDKVTLLLERKDYLRDFLFCMVYGLIARHTYEEGGTTYSIWRLAFPTEEGRTEEWYLTKPVTAWPPLLEAIANFNYLSRDVGHGEDYHKTFDVENQVRPALVWKRDQDVAARVQTGIAGEHAPADVRASIDNLPEASKQETLRTLARRDPLIPFQERIQKELLPAWQAELENQPDLQQDIDLAAIFWLILEDEAKQLLNATERRIQEITKPKLPMI